MASLTQRVDIAFTIPIEKTLEVNTEGQLQYAARANITKTKRFFWKINKFLNFFIISGLQKFGLHRNMQNKVELFDRGPGQKMGCNKLLKN